MISSGLTFGIYTLSAAGTPFGVAVVPEEIMNMVFHTLCKALATTKGC